MEKSTSTEHFRSKQNQEEDLQMSNGWTDSFLALTKLNFTTDLFAKLEINKWTSLLVTAVSPKMSALSLTFMFILARLRLLQIVIFIYPSAHVRSKKCVLFCVPPHVLFEWSCFNLSAAQRCNRSKEGHDSAIKSAHECVCVGKISDSGGHDYSISPNCRQTNIACTHLREPLTGVKKA